MSLRKIILSPTVAIILSASTFFVWAKEVNVKMTEQTVKNTFFIENI